MDKYLTTEEVAETLRVSAATVRHWRYLKTGPRVTTVGRRVLYGERDLATWVAGQQLPDKASA